MCSAILRMHSAISRLRKFLNCAEHIYSMPVMVVLHWQCGVMINSKLQLMVKTKLTGEVGGFQH